MSRVGGAQGLVGSLAR